MIGFHRSKVLAAVVAAAAALAGCALLATPDPVQLYRFGALAESPSASSAQLEPLLLRRIEMTQASAGDRILAVTGVESAYIGAARWVSPAQTLFNESLEATFAARATRVRLAHRRELSRAERILEVDVRAFEARYAAPGAAPEVVVVVRASLFNVAGRSVADERTFTVRRPADANRVGAIVAAFDAAVRDVNTQIVAWADAPPGR